ncbi:hypothetical protein ACVWZK_003077 [Bradyrhizobium sp. GM0.4]
MKLYLGEGIYEAHLRREAEQWEYARLLLADDWRPMSEYVYDRTYVYAAGSEGGMNQLFVGRGGRYSVSPWWSPNNTDTPVPLYVNAWKPLPDGVDPRTHALDIFPPRAAKPTRPPEPVYEPAAPTTRLTPVPRDLLVAMHGGAALHERTWSWTSWTLQRPGRAPEKISSRGVDRLRECAFIERAGVLPPGNLTRFYNFDWRITPAGAAWLAAH